jgi:hypothetical protein
LPCGLFLLAPRHKHFGHVVLVVAKKCLSERMCRG